MKAHPLSDGLIPNGKGTLKISSLAAQKPPQSNKSSSTSSSKPYDFESVLDLPKRFRTRPMEESEIDNINTGGASLLF